MPRVAVLHPGEMGSAVWRCARRDRRREGGPPVAAQTNGGGADDAGLLEVIYLEGCDVVLSVCPPGAAV